TGISVPVLFDRYQIYIPRVPSLCVAVYHRPIRSQMPSPARIREAHAKVKQNECSLNERSSRPWLERSRQLELIDENRAPPSAGERPEERVLAVAGRMTSTGSLITVIRAHPPRVRAVSQSRFWSGHVL